MPSNQYFEVEVGDGAYLLDPLVYIRAWKISVWQAFGTYRIHDKRHVFRAHDRGDEIGAVTRPQRRQFEGFGPNSEAM
jgi:hypothetical protein